MYISEKEFDNLYFNKNYLEAYPFDKNEIAFFKYALNYLIKEESVVNILDLLFLKELIEKL